LVLLATRVLQAWRQPSTGGRLATDVFEIPVCSLVSLEKNRLLSLSGEKDVEIIPVTQYRGDNKQLINKAFYDALTGGADVGETQIVQMVLALLDRSMGLSWVANNPTIKAVFNWLLVTVYDNAKVPAAFNMGSRLVSCNEAMHDLLQDCESAGARSYAARFPTDMLAVIASLGTRRGAVLSQRTTQPG